MFEFINNKLKYNFDFERLQEIKDKTINFIKYNNYITNTPDSHSLLHLLEINNRACEIIINYELTNTKLIEVYDIILVSCLIRNYFDKKHYDIDIEEKRNNLIRLYSNLISQEKIDIIIEIVKTSFYNINNSNEINSNFNKKIFNDGSDNDIAQNIVIQAILLTDYDVIRCFTYNYFHVYKNNNEIKFTDIYNLVISIFNERMFTYINKQFFTCDFTRREASRLQKKAIKKLKLIEKYIINDIKGSTSNIQKMPIIFDYCCQNIITVSEEYNELKKNDLKKYLCDNSIDNFINNYDLLKNKILTDKDKMYSLIYDVSHNIYHHIDVVLEAIEIFDSKPNEIIFLDNTSIIFNSNNIYMCAAACLLHDTLDDKYFSEDYINEKLEKLRTNKIFETVFGKNNNNIEILITIIKTMSYSKTQGLGEGKNKFGNKVNECTPLFPEQSILGTYITAYHVTREADLLTAYNFDRCVLYTLFHNKDCLHSHAVEVAYKLFSKRMFKHLYHNLFVTEHSKIKAKEYDDEARKSISRSLQF